MIPALGSGGKEDQEYKVIFTYIVNEFWASLAYMRLCLNKRENKKRGRKKRNREERKRREQ